MEAMIQNQKKLLNQILEDDLRDFESDKNILETLNKEGASDFDIKAR